MATLLDEGEYHCSIRTMYRLLEQRGESRERRDQLLHPPYQKPELMAARPQPIVELGYNQATRSREMTYFYLYVILDVFSRYVTGWMVAYRESAELAKRLIEESCQKQGIQPGQLTLHAIAGPRWLQTGGVFWLADLGVTKTHSRPHVSNDKSVFGEPIPNHEVSAGVSGPFGCLQDSRAFCQGFFRWYNEEHRHSGLGLLTTDDGALWSSRKRAAATSNRARCCLSTSPGTLRTKRSQVTGSSQRSLDNQAGFHSGTAAVGSGR